MWEVAPGIMSTEPPGTDRRVRIGALDLTPGDLRRMRAADLQYFRLRMNQYPEHSEARRKYERQYQTLLQALRQTDPLDINKETNRRKP